MDSKEIKLEPSPIIQSPQPHSSMFKRLEHRVKAAWSPKPKHELEHSGQTNMFKRLDTLTWSKWHTKMAIILGIGWAMDSFETTVVSASIVNISKTFDITSDFDKSLITSVWYCHLTQAWRRYARIVDVRIHLRSVRS
jgi:hypothetical protein